MAVKIRLMRIGKNKTPLYRIVAMEEFKKRNSNYLEQLGFYNPLLEKDAIQVDKDKVMAWINKGAQFSEGAGRLLRKMILG
jgi:small subunit ribosomal protein S16